MADNFQNVTTVSRGFHPFDALGYLTRGLRRFVGGITGQYLRVTGVSVRSIAYIVPAMREKYAIALTQRERGSVDIGAQSFVTVDTGGFGEITNITIREVI